jgi:tRNA pseudouridine38-40 synthase
LNYRVTLAYDGTDYHGFQWQNGFVTIQSVLGDALQKLAGEPVIIHAAGRTDAGVHAEGQVVSFRLNKPFDERRLRNALNGNLPYDIRALSAEVAPDDFHARYHAQAKTYRYQLYVNQVMNPLWSRYAWHFAYELDAERLRADAAVLLGQHDFTAFTVSSSAVKSHVRTLTDFQLDTDGVLWRLWFRGNGFLRYQVRTMVGALVDVNRQRLSVNSLSEILARRDRNLAGAAAPAHGLTLAKVEY